MDTEADVAFAAVMMSIFASVHKEGDDTAAAPQPEHKAESTDYPGQDPTLIHHPGFDPLSTVLAGGHGGDITQVPRTNHYLDGLRLAHLHWLRSHLDHGTLLSLVLDLLKRSLLERLQWGRGLCSVGRRRLGTGLERGTTCFHIIHSGLVVHVFVCVVLHRQKSVRS